MDKLRAMVTGIHGYVPEYRLTNKELESLVDTNDEWIMSRTGIKERRILKGENQGTSVLGIEAVKGLLEKTGTDPLDVELIICATVTPDMPFPATANIIADKVGAKNSFSFDIGAACSGFLYALQLGAQFIQAGTHKKVIVVGADKMSSIVDYTDRTTCIIFGDGGGAVLFEPSPNEFGWEDEYFRSNGSERMALRILSGGSLHPTTQDTLDQGWHNIYQEGKVVFKYAVSEMSHVAEQIMKRNNLEEGKIDYLIPHQANKRIIDATSNRLDLSNDKVLMNIDRYGNTTAATLPLLLYDYESKFKKGDKLVFAAFGGGFTWGAAHLTWAY